MKVLTERLDRSRYRASLEAVVYVDGHRFRVYIERTREGGRARLDRWSGIRWEYVCAIPIAQTPAQQIDLEEEDPIEEWRNDLRATRANLVAEALRALKEVEA